MKTCYIYTIIKNKGIPYTSNWGHLLLRLTLAITIWPHGAQKVLGWFGGGGFSATYKGFTEGMGIWAPLAIVAILTEFLAPVFLIAGFFTRLAGLALAILMTVAMSMHMDNGFFINWAGNQAGEGIEYHLLFIGMAVAVLLLGAGKYSFDNYLWNKYFMKKD